MAEAPEPSSSSSPPPQPAASAPTDAPRRSTGEIPLSWAMPAEAVSDAPTGASSNTILVGAVATAFAIGLAVAAAGVFGTPSSSTRTPGPSSDVAVVAAPGPAPIEAPEPRPVDVAEAAVPVVPMPAPVPPAAVPTATPPPAVTPPAAVTPPTGATVPPTRLRARALIAKARLAARDGDREQALKLADQAVALDDGCGGCWRTLALLRKQGGDKVGAADAKKKAESAADPLP